MPRASQILGALALLFILLGLGYDRLTPIFENSDEHLHYAYIKNLADGHGLPVAIPDQLWNQEGTQHPLYYSIVAASTFWLNTDTLPAHLEENPHWLFTEIRSLINDNQNRVLHSDLDTFPYQRAALAIHIGRWWSLFFGMITVIFTFLIAQRLFPNHLPLATIATALTAFTPQFIRVSATVSNDSLSAALTTLAVWATLKFSDPFPQKSTRWTQLAPPLMLGLLCGLALLTKLSSVSTIFIVALILFWRFFVTVRYHPHPSPLPQGEGATIHRIVPPPLWGGLRGGFLQWLLLIGLVTALLNGWWFWRNYQLYGEWLATETHLNLAGRGDLSPTEVWGLRAEVERAYWATFGWGQLRLPEPFYIGLAWFVRLGLVGLVILIIINIKQLFTPRSKHPQMQSGVLGLSWFNPPTISLDKLLLLLCWTGVNLALYVRWVMVVGSVSHTRLIFPAITAISLLLGLGWLTLLPRRWAGGFSGIIIAVFLSLNIYSLGWLLYPAFTPNQEPLMVNEGAALHLTFLEQLQLTEATIGVQNKDNDWRQPAVPGDTVLVQVRWQVLTPIDKNYSVAVALLAPDGRVLAQRETYPGLGLRPTKTLQPHDTFVDIYPLTIQDTITDYQIGRISVSLFDLDSATRSGFPAIDAAGNEVTPLVGQIKLSPTTPPVYQPTYPLNTTFAQAITLTGYDLSPESITFYWQSAATVPDDYNLFLHFLDAEGQVITQADAPPTHGAYPTRWWTPGETIADRHPLPPNISANSIRLGLYQLETGQRLPVTSTDLPQQDNAVEISLP